MKKILAVTLILLMAFSFYGCNSGPDVPEPDPNTPADDTVYGPIVNEALDNIFAANPRIALGILSGSGEDVEFSKSMSESCHAILNAIPGEKYAEIDIEIKKFAQLSLQSVEPMLDANYETGTLSEKDDEKFKELTREAVEVYKGFRDTLAEINESVLGDDDPDNPGDTDQEDEDLDVE